MSTAFQYDVFLSHNSKDKPRVRALAERLRSAGLRVWFDEWVIAFGFVNITLQGGFIEDNPFAVCRRSLDRHNLLNFRMLAVVSQSIIYVTSTAGTHGIRKS